MPLSLYEVSLPSYLQTVVATLGIIQKGRAYFEENGVALEPIIAVRLAPDMRTFSYQVQQVCNLSIGGVQALRTGQFSMQELGGDPDLQLNFDELEALLIKTEQALREVDEAEVNTWEDKEVQIQLPDHTARFKATDYVLSLSIPNCHFHCATAYNILRQAGVPIGKRDFLGAYQDAVRVIR